MKDKEGDGSSSSSSWGGGGLYMVTKTYYSSLSFVGKENEICKVNKKDDRVGETAV